MSHSFANDQLTAYLDGELEPAEVLALESALAADPRLREELEQLERVVGLLEAHGRAQAPPDFHARVMAAVDAERPAPTFWDWLRRPFGLPIEGLAIALAAAVVLWVALPSALDEPAPDAAVGDGGAAATVVPSAERESPRVAATGEGGGKVAKEADVPRSSPTAEARDGVAAADPPERAYDPRRASRPTSAPSGLADAAGPEPAPITTGAEKTDDPATAPPPPGADDEPLDPEPAGYATTAYSDSPTALADILRVAGKHGATVHDAEDHPLRDASLGASEVQLLVYVPSTALSRFNRDLEAVMLRVEVQAPAGLNTAAYTRVAIRLKLVGGAVDAPKAAPADSVRSKMANEADILDEVQTQ